MISSLHCSLEGLDWSPLSSRQGGGKQIKRQFSDPRSHRSPTDTTFRCRSCFHAATLNAIVSATRIVGGRVPDGVVPRRHHPPSSERIQKVASPLALMLHFDVASTEASRSEMKTICAMFQAVLTLCATSAKAVGKKICRLALQPHRPPQRSSKADCAANPTRYSRG